MLMLGGAMHVSAQNELGGTLKKDGSTSTSSSSSSSSGSSSTSSNGYGISTDTPDDSTKSNEPAGIVFDRDEEADSLLATMVYNFPDTRRDVKLYMHLHPSLMPDAVAAHNPTQRIGGKYYLDLGALGQSHLTLMPYHDNPKVGMFVGQSEPLTLSLSADANRFYTQELHHYRYYQTLRPYTMLRYGSSMNKDYQIGIVHTQNIKPRWNVAFLFHQVAREGLYTNSGLKNSLIDVTTNYYSADARYQLQAGLSRQNLFHEENGGIADDTTWWTTSKRSGVPVNMYTAANQWRNLNLYVHQTFNTVRQFERIRPIVRQISDTTQVPIPKDPADTTVQAQPLMRDTIIVRDTIVGYDTIPAVQPSLFNTGVIGLDLTASRQRRNFYDSQAECVFYSFGQIDSTIYFDSTRHLRLSADLYWTNDAYMQSRWHLPLTATVGLRPEIDQVRYITSTRREMGVSAYGRARLNFGGMQLAVEGEKIHGGLRAGDYRLSGALATGLGWKSSLVVSAKSEALAPSLLYYHNEGCYSWDYANDHYNKEKQQQLSLTYLYAQRDTLPGIVRKLSIDGHATRLADNVWLTSTMTPTQGSESALLLQAEANAHFRFSKWLHLNMQEIVQYSDNDNVVRVPTFASKQSLYADLYVFHRALHLQTGADLRYHTRYLADGWNPILGAFYRQDDMMVGNYLVVDLWVTLQIKRASIYLRASHLNAPLEQQPTYFSLPHYPLEDLGVYWGVIWKFFN